MPGQVRRATKPTTRPKDEKSSYTTHQDLTGAPPAREDPASPCPLDRNDYISVETEKPGAIELLLEPWSPPVDLPEMGNKLIDLGCLLGSLGQFAHLD